jgi:hypothetical protein
VASETASNSPTTDAFVPAPDDWGKGQPLDLTSYYSTPAAVFPRITSNPWRDVAVGAQTFNNVRLIIGGSFSLQGTTESANGSRWPARVTGINVNRTFPSLYVYHCAWNTSPEGAPIANVVCNYADGTTVTNQIRYGADVRDWYEKPGEANFDASDPRSRIVWIGPNRSVAGTQLRFFLTEMQNTKPDVAVATLDLVSTGASASSCVMALTTGPAGLSTATRK